MTEEGGTSAKDAVQAYKDEFGETPADFFARFLKLPIEPELPDEDHPKPGETVSV